MTHIQADHANSEIVAADAMQIKTTSTTTYPGFVDSKHSEDSSDPSVLRRESNRELEQLMIQARNLKRNHQLVSQQVQEAQARLDQNELHRGQMIQQYLQLGREIKLKEEDIAADETRMESLRLSQDKFAREISDLLGQIQRVAQ